MSTSKLEVKVPVAAGGGVLGVAVAQFLLWLAERYWLHGPAPEQVTYLVWTVVPFALTWAAGYWAPHTSRPDLTPPQPAAPAGVQVLKPPAAQAPYPQP